MTSHSQAGTILVTGATGNVGRHVVDQLVRLGAAVRAGVRDPERVRAAFPDGVDVAQLDFADAGTFAGALDGVGGLFLVRPPALSDVARTLIPLVDQAARADVGHVVFLSVAGAERARFIPHAKVEAHLAQSSVAWTFLRAGFFAQNLGDAYRRDIRDHDRIIVPAGRGAASFVDGRDLAEVAARALVDGALKGEAPALYGPEALDFAQVALVLSELLGRAITYEPVSAPGYLRHLRRQGDPWGQALVKAALHLGLRFGQGRGDAAALERLLGRAPRTVRGYVEDHRNQWKLRDP